jgi:hypothetical protein
LKKLAITIILLGNNLIMLIKKIRQKIRVTWISSVIFLLKNISKIQGREAVFEFSEFTWDMVRGLPKAYYYEKNNIDYNLFIKSGLKGTYFFSKNIFEIKLFNNLNSKETYNREKPSFTNANWLPPPLELIFRNNDYNFKKEVVVIQNKYSVEWNEKPYNFFDLSTLKNLFRVLTKKYDVVYIRPESSIKKGYFQDDNEILNFEDYKLIEEKFPNVFTLRNFLNKENDFNITQFKLHSNSLKHICVSGGNACIASYFKGEVLIYDSPEGIKREIWDSNSWLSELSGSKINGFNDKDKLLKFVIKNWT